MARRYAGRESLYSPSFETREKDGGAEIHFNRAGGPKMLLAAMGWRGELMMTMCWVLLLVSVGMGLALPSAAWATGQENRLAGARPHAGIAWLSWDQAAFDRAKAEDKLILLDLTAVWCHACHMMDITTYADPEVHKLVRQHFIPIRVDTDQRPDIARRYKHGGWPTTSILLPTGEIVFQANALDPEELIAVLEDTENLYRRHKHTWAERAAQIWEKVNAAHKARVLSQRDIEPELVVREAVAFMQEHFDPVHGGFRNAPKFFEPEAITLIFQLAMEWDDASLREMAIQTLNQQQRLLDPVWGGFYRYAEHADWTHPHYEKLLSVQATNLVNYLDAYQATRDDQYKRVARRIIQYVNRFLVDRQRGGFFASQAADLLVSGELMDGDTYFALTQAQRLAVGIPPVDRTIYTDWNGLMVSSYLKAYQVLGDEDLRELALKTLHRLVNERYRPGKGIAHAAGFRGQEDAVGLLSDQVFFARALLEAFLTTAELRYFVQTESLVQDLLDRFWDKQGGGFYDRPPMPSLEGLLRFPQKPLTDNIQAALLFCDLFYLTEQESYRRIAQETLQYVLAVPQPLPVALLARAVYRLHHDPVHVVVVGTRSDKAVQELFTQSLRLYFPGKLVRLLDPQRDSLTIGTITFPRFPAPRAYICTSQVCSQPIQSAGQLQTALDTVLSTMRQIP
ncbi:MAG: thioredoxin domain-containing protein [Nitrospirae bacterium]|nr:MAG: thioredoxin domain-containing protein [Nitrospirota bacterium]